MNTPHKEVTTTATKTTVPEEMVNNRTEGFLVVLLEVFLAELLEIKLEVKTMVN